MTWQYTVFVYPTIFATIVSALLGAYSLQYMHKNGRTPVLLAFLAANGGLVLWTGFSALKLLHTDPTVKLLMYRLLYFGISLLGTFALLFALAYTDRKQWLRKEFIAALVSVPFLFWILLFTNPSGLVIESTRIVETNGLVVLRVNVGPAHLWLQDTYNALLSLIAAAIVGYEAVRLGRSYLPQAVLLGIGIAAPIVFMILTNVGVPPFDPDGVNLVPTSAAITSSALGIALFRYRMLNLPPIAYTTAMEESPDGVLVLDSTKRIVHTNERGSQLLSWLGAGSGDPIDDVLPGIDLTGPGDDGVHIDSIDGSSTYFSARVQRLNRQERCVGWVIVFRDVTELHRQKQTIEDQNKKLTLLNQIVRHDIRNDMSVILGNARLIDGVATDDVMLERLDRIVANSNHVVELTDTVRNLMETMLGDTESTRPVSLDAVLRSEIDGLQVNDEHITIESEGGNQNHTVLADEMLGTVFRNLLTNAIRHTDADEPEVIVTVDESEHDVFVRVADNGPGIPDGQKDSVFGRGEKGLESPGTGIGLYLVETIVTGYGGEVWIEDHEPRGAVFVVQLPRM